MLVVERVVLPGVARWVTESPRGKEEASDARMGAEANTTRIGAVALPLAIIVFVVSMAIHPSREDIMGNKAVFMEYAHSQSWIAVRLAQWVAALLLFDGLVAVYYTVTRRPDACAALAHFGLALAVLTAASLTMLQAIEGVALKATVGVRASTPADV